MKNINIVFVLLFLLTLFSGSVYAEVRIGVLDVELKDVTLLPNRPEERERTASIQPLLTTELEKAGVVVLAIDSSAQQAATMGKGYLFDHADVAAQLGKKVGADYVIVGRLHKPSFLFAYLLAQVVEVKSGMLIDSLSVEAKGSGKKTTAKAVEVLADKIKFLLQSRCCR